MVDKETMELLSKYEGWKLSEPRIAQTQLNMCVGVVKAEKFDVLDQRIVRRVILTVINNHTQFETMITEEAWNHIRQDEEPISSEHTSYLMSKLMEVEKAMQEIHSSRCVYPDDDIICRTCEVCMLYADVQNAIEKAAKQVEKCRKGDPNARS